MELDVIIGFQKWLGKQKSVDNKDTPKSYVSYLKGLQKDICKYWNSHDIVNEWTIADEKSVENQAKLFAQKALLRNDTKFSFIEVIDALYKEGYLLYAITIIDYIQLITAEIKRKGASNTFLKRVSAINSFHDFLVLGYKCKKKSNHIALESILTIANINKGNLSHIDGMQGLIKEVGEATFIKYAIEHSYFFDPEIVNKRMQEFVEKFKVAKEAKDENGALHARKSRDMEFYQSDDTLSEKSTSSVTYKRYKIDKDSSKTVPVRIDKVGNNPVKSLITTYTGYTVSAGKGSIFQNYIISHLWGMRMIHVTLPIFGILFLFQHGRIVFLTKMR